MEHETAKTITQAWDDDRRRVGHYDENPLHVAARLRGGLEALPEPEAWAIVSELAVTERRAAQAGHLDVLLLTGQALTVAAIRSTRTEGVASLKITAHSYPLRDCRACVEVEWRQLTPDESYRVTEMEISVDGELLARVSYGISGHEPDRPDDRKAEAFVTTLLRRLV